MKRIVLTSALMVGALAMLPATVDARGFGGRGGLPSRMSLIWSESIVSHSSNAFVIASTLSRFSTIRRFAS